MNRVNYINENFNLNSTSKATRYANQLKIFNNEVLEKFVNFVWENKKEYEVIDQAILRCLKEFKTILTLNSIQNGDSSFPTAEAMIAFLKSNFKGKDIANGVGYYNDYVIVAMDKDGYLVNRYTMTDYGKPIQLDCEEETRFYQMLFKEQNKIGVIKRFNYREVHDRLEQQDKELKRLQNQMAEQNKKIDQNTKIADKVLETLIKKSMKVINKRINNAS